MRSSVGVYFRAILAVAVHPSLWLTALRQMVRFARPRWWRQAPFLPIPDADYLRFRMETQYGTQTGSLRSMDGADLVVYLRWCRTLGR